MSGGTSINTIAAQAWLELDIRSESPQVLTEVTRAVENLVKEANTLSPFGDNAGISRTDVRVEAQVIGRRPAGDLSKDHPLVQLAEACLREQGIKPKLVIGSTDANIPLSRGIPALVLGVTNGAGAHTTGEFIYTKPIERGMAQLLAFVQHAWE
jgi:acetylornithine deacetylase/succinyl-diaminopimelate desuccinylase-like protein